MKKKIEYVEIIGMSNNTQSIFKVQGSTGNIYNVDIVNNTCTCPHYIHRLTGKAQDCKHIKMVKQNRTAVSKLDAQLVSPVYAKVKKLTYQEIAAQAIYKLNNDQGSSRQAIKAFLELGVKKWKFLNKALAKGVKSGFFKMNKGKYKLVEKHDIVDQAGLVVNVKGSQDREYQVDLVNKTCTCPHYVYRLAGTDKLCKHMEYVEKQGKQFINSDAKDSLCSKQDQNKNVNQQNSDDGEDNVINTEIECILEKMGLDEKQKCHVLERIQEYRDYNRLKKENAELRIQLTMFRM